MAIRLCLGSRTKTARYLSDRLHLTSHIVQEATPPGSFPLPLAINLISANAAIYSRRDHSFEITAT
jgi:hypothetical protein